MSVQTSEGFGNNVKDLTNTFIGEVARVPLNYVYISKTLHTDGYTNLASSNEHKTSVTNY